MEKAPCGSVIHLYANGIWPVGTEGQRYVMETRAFRLAPTTVDEV